MTAQSNQSCPTCSGPVIYRGYCPDAAVATHRCDPLGVVEHLAHCSDTDPLQPSLFAGSPESALEAA